MNINRLYRSVLNDVENVLGNDSTFSDELNKFCKKYFGSKFVGVFASDQIPNLKNNEYAIVNLDKSNEPGSHWVSLAMVNNKLNFYDSFGRTPRIIGLGSKNINYDKSDGEQKDSEENCGQRAITYLIIGDELGFNVANKI